MLVKVVGINRFKDRHGKERLYYRRTGAPTVALDPKLTGAALAAEVARLDKLYFAPKARAGTMRQLIIDYKAKSNHWKGLRGRTRVDYERVFTWLGKGLDLPLIGISAPEVAKARDAAAAAFQPKFANQVVVVLRKVFSYGMEYGFLRSNPALHIAKATGGKTHENRPPTPAEAAILLDTAPAALLAYFVMLNLIVLHFLFQLFPSDQVLQYKWLDTDTYRMLLGFNLFFLFNRILQRTFFTASIYGLANGLMAGPRMIVSNFLNYFATARAVYIFVRHKVTGRQIVWDKTMHTYPV